MITSGQEFGTSKKHIVMKLQVISMCMIIVIFFWKLVTENDNFELMYIILIVTFYSRIYRERNVWKYRSKRLNNVRCNIQLFNLYMVQITISLKK